MKERLRRALSRRRKRRIVDAELVPSAVLVPIYYHRGEYHLLFTKRTRQVKEHKGQVSFPGGAYQDGDGKLVNTALRECAEEIGLGAGDVEVLGELDDFATQASNYVIAPFVAIIPWPYEFHLNEIETEALIEVPVSALLDMERPRQETRLINGETVTSFFYDYRGTVIWGATARILNQFLDIFARARKAG